MLLALDVKAGPQSSPYGNTTCLSTFGRRSSSISLAPSSRRSPWIRGIRPHRGPVRRLPSAPSRSMLGEASPGEVEQLGIRFDNNA